MSPFMARLLIGVVLIGGLTAGGCDGGLIPTPAPPRPTSTPRCEYDCDGGPKAGPTRVPTIAATATRGRMAICPCGDGDAGRNCDDY